MRLIDADALVERWKRIASISWNDTAVTSWSHAYEEIISEIEEEPTIEAEPVVYGKWEWNENAIDWGLGAWVCSKCYSTNENIHARKDGNPLFWKGSQRCPVCGARMMSYTPPEPYKG